MSKYTLSFKRNDVYVEVVTEDKDYIGRELENLISDLSIKRRKVNPVNLLQETYEETQKSFDDLKKEKQAKFKQEDSKEKVEIKPDKQPENEPEAFSKLLDQKIKEPESPSEKESIPSNEINSFEDMLKEKDASTLIDYLVIAALYLNDTESLERFSLKQVNAKVVSAGKKPIDHSVIQKAIAKDLIKIVPDYTGIADVTEYTITQKGREYFQNEL